MLIGDALMPYKRNVYLNQVLHKEGPVEALHSHASNVNELCFADSLQIEKNYELVNKMDILIMYMGRVRLVQQVEQTQESIYQKIN